MRILPHKYLIVGIDLAWGEKRPDGVCAGTVQNGCLEVECTTLLHGDAQILDFLQALLQKHKFVFLAMDAPVICPNKAGSRPVDREAQSLFQRQHAGPHPCNQLLCKRPLRIVKNLATLGFVPGWNFAKSKPFLIAEVFPHPAIVRWGRLDRTLKYKRSPVAQRRIEFDKLQSLLRSLLKAEFADVRIDQRVDYLLAQHWSKDIEDQTDAMICMLVAWQHLRSRGRASEILGELESGFILLPKSMKRARQPCGNAGSNHQVPQ